MFLTNILFHDKKFKGYKRKKNGLSLNTCVAALFSWWLSEAQELLVWTWSSFLHNQVYFEEFMWSKDRSCVCYKFEFLLYTLQNSIMYQQWIPILRKMGILWLWGGFLRQRFVDFPSRILWFFFSSKGSCLPVKFQMSGTSEV